MERGNSCSGIDLTSQNQYSWCFKDKTVAPVKGVKSMTPFNSAEFPSFCFLQFHVKISVHFSSGYRGTSLTVAENNSLNLGRL
jgi:hypothetical protein